MILEIAGGIIIAMIVLTLLPIMFYGFVVAFPYILSITVWCAGVYWMYNHGITPETVMIVIVGLFVLYMWWYNETH